MSGVLGRHAAAVLEAVDQWDRQIETLTGLRDTFRARVAQEQANLDVAQRTLESAEASRAALMDSWILPERELRRPVADPPAAEGDWQLEGGAQ